METFIAQLKLNKEDILDSLYKRMDTSRNNKEAHKKMIDWISKDEWEDVKSFLVNDQYYSFNPLSGVCLCVRTDIASKTALYASYETMLSSLDEHYLDGH